MGWENEMGYLESIQISEGKELLHSERFKVL